MIVTSRPPCGPPPSALFHPPPALQDSDVFWSLRAFYTIKDSACEHPLVWDGFSALVPVPILDILSGAWPWSPV